MKIIDAVWEKKNLGYDTVEIRCTYEDSNLEKEQIKKLRQPYQVIKIPCAKSNLLLQAQELGFQMIECQIAFKTKIAQLHLPEKFLRFTKDLTYHEATKAEITDVLQRVRKGNTFTRDRIAMDPYFSVVIAGRRYANWMEDLMAKGYVMYMKVYRNQTFGWVICAVSEDKVADMVLGGNFQDNVWAGMGIAGHYLTVQIAQNIGAENLHEVASSNNLRSIKILLEFGSNIEHIEYVLIKHLN